MQSAPGLLVDFGLERGLERLVRVVRAQKIRVSDEEALLVVIGVDEPAGDPLGAVAAFDRTRYNDSFACAFSSSGWLPRQ